MTARWYVVQTRARAESVAREHLHRQGFTTYLPEMTKSRSHARRTETVRRPLFPRYLFILIDTAHQRWRAIRSTMGVTALLGDENGPTPVRPDIVESIREQVRMHDLAHAGAAKFLPGNAIRIADGLFASCAGFFEAMNEKQRVLVLLDLLGRRVRVVVDAKSVVPA